MSGAATAALVTAGSLLFLPSAHAADEVVAEIRWAADTAENPLTTNVDTSGFTRDGGTIAFTYAPRYVSGSPEALTQCGYDPAAIQPFTWEFSVSDQTPTDAYVGTPNLVYSWWHGEDGSGRGFVYSVQYGRNGRLQKNTGSFGRQINLSTVPVSPSVSVVDGRLITPDWVAPTADGTGLFVTTQMHTIAASPAPDLPDFLNVTAPLSWRARLNATYAGRDASAGIAGFDGVAAETPASSYKAPGEQVTVQQVAALDTDGNVNPSTTLQVSVLTVTAQVSCDTEPTTEPTTGPTTEPTTGPTAGPTTEPTTEPTTPNPTTPAALPTWQPTQGGGGGRSTAVHGSRGAAVNTGGEVVAEGPSLVGPISLVAAGFVVAAFAVLAVRRQRG